MRQPARPDLWEARVRQPPGPTRQVRDGQRTTRPSQVSSVLAGYASQVAGLRYRTERDLLGRPDFVIWSFAVINDPRGWEDRAAPARR